jgi:hypothetical protein
MAKGQSGQFQLGDVVDGLDVGVMRSSNFMEIGRAKVGPRA